MPDRGGRAGRRGGSPARRGGLRLPAALSLLVALLAGCAQIPSSGPVVPGQPIDAPRRYPQFFADEAQPGATPEQLVRGFLKAAADYRREHAVARSYLAPGPQTSWVADAPVVVYAGPSPQLVGPPVTPGRPSSPGPPRDGSTTTVRVTVQVLATIDGAGVYTVAPAGTVDSRTFGLVASAGQWRIATLGDGILVSQSDFRSTFQDLPVYFPDPLGTWMIPDMRWFPVSGGDSATTTIVKLVTALLTGPSPWLAPAVSNAFPPGTRLSVNESVPVDLNGIASVDLTRQVQAATPRQRQVLRLQLLDTLGLSAGAAVSVTGLAGVDVKVAGSTLDIPGVQVSSAQGQPRPRSPVPKVCRPQRGCRTRRSPRTAPPSPPWPTDVTGCCSRPRGGPRPRSSPAAT